MVLDTKQDTISRLLSVALSTHCPYEERSNALRDLAAINALAASVVEQARRRAVAQWLYEQIIILNRKADRLADEWWEDKLAGHATVTLEEWLHGRKLAAVNPDNGIVEGTNLHWKTAQELSYGTISFAFKLECIDDYMVFGWSRHRITTK